ncbi:MAG: TonB-dependent receptor plug domain-containing protein [Gemmatimonadaceae bacterium]
MTNMHRLVTLALALAAHDLIAQAADTTQLRTVVVSASKVPRPAATLSQAVTVLSGDDLRARGVTRVADALREVPGASLVQSGSYGALTSLFLRGGESRYTKVLIDGVPVNSPGGFFDFSHLTTDNIDRIEIVRGPASVLYGADAVSGIVQIFTRRAAGNRRASLAARGGTYRSFDLNADAAGASAIGDFSVGAGHHMTDGVLPFNNEYRNGTLSSALSLANSAVGEARIAGRYTAAEFHYPTDFTGQPVDSNSYRVQHRLTVGLDAGRNLNANVQARLLAGNNDVSDLSEDIAVPFGSSTPEHSAFRSRGFRRNIEGRVAFFLPRDGTLTVGAAYEKEHEVSSSESGDVGGPTTQTDSFEASRHNLGYYSELLGSLVDRISYTISGRIDDNSDYRRFATYRVGVNAALVPALRIRGSLSTAFNAPAFNQLRPTLYTVGSPDLRPERIRSAEVGLVTNFAPDFIQISTSYFTQRFADLIQYINGAAPTFLGSYSNLNAATSNGYEADVQLSPTMNWRGSASYTVVNPRVTRVDPGYEGSARAGDALIRRPTHSGSLVVSYAQPLGASFGTSVSFVGKRPDVDFAQSGSPRVTLPGYAKVDVAAEYPLTGPRRGGLTFTARIENLFDRRYEDVLNFRAPGRAVLIGGRATAPF